jgi:hypothetical protein
MLVGHDHERTGRRGPQNAVVTGEEWALPLRGGGPKVARTAEESGRFGGRWLRPAWAPKARRPDGAADRGAAPDPE